MYNRQFRAGFARLGLAAATALAIAPVALGAGCARRPAGLSRSEQRLVLQLVEQARARLARAGADSSGVGTAVPDSAGPAEALAALSPAWLDSAGVEQRLTGPWEALWRDPERGRRVLQAVHDSLEALRPKLFPPPPRPVPPPGTPAAGAVSRPRVP